MEIDLLDLSDRVMGQPSIDYQNGKFYKVKDCLYKAGRGNPKIGYIWCIDGIEYEYIGSVARRDRHYAYGEFFEENNNWAVYKLIKNAFKIPSIEG